MSLARESSNTAASPSTCPPGGICDSREFQCYGLPYGGLGFASHILTLYTIIALAHNRRPLLPFKPLKQSRRWLTWNSGTVLLSLIGTAITTSVTIVHCNQKHEWEFAAIAGWQLCISITQALIALYTTIANYRYIRDEWDERTVATGVEVKGHKRSHHFWFLVVYIPGFIAGLAGLIALFTHPAGDVVSRLKNVRNGVAILTCMLIPGLIFVFFVVYKLWQSIVPWEDGSSRMRRTLLSFLLALSLLGPITADWTLAALAEDWAGYNRKLSAALKAAVWLYFVCKRLPMLSV